MLTTGIEERLIEGVRVRSYRAPKTVVDLFRYRRSAGKRHQKSPGLNLALEGLREALRLRKATRPKLHAMQMKSAWGKVVQPYREAMTANGDLSTQLTDMIVVPALETAETTVNNLLNRIRAILTRPSN